MLLQPKWNPKNKFCVVRVHYTHDPEKNNPEWIKSAKEGVSDRTWNREYEISYDTFEGEPVYKDFKEEHILEINHKPGQYVYRGWDFGYHHPFCLFAFIDDKDRLIIRREVMGENVGIREFGKQVLLRSQEWFPDAMAGGRFLDCCDPAGHQKSDKSEFTSVQILNDLGIYPTSKASAIITGLEMIRQRHLRRNDGLFGFHIHPDCKIMIDGFKGGYRYPDKIEGNKEEPLKDGYYDHGHDCLRYIAVNFLELAPSARVTTANPSENTIMQSQSENLGDFF